MTLDSERQREMLLALINAATIPGAAIKDAHALVTAIETAGIAPANPIETDGA